MTVLALAMGEYDLPARNRLAAEAIERYATELSVLVVGGSLAIGFLPRQGDGPASILAATAAQIPVYQAIARELSYIYRTPVEDIAQGIIRDDRSTQSDTDLVSEFNRGFLTEIIADLAGEIGIGRAASFVPFIDMALPATLDVAVAVTLAWRVGAMASIFYQYGERWVGSRKETYQRAKSITGELSPATAHRVDLNDIPLKEEVVRRYHLEQTVEFIKSLREAEPTVSSVKLRTILRNKGFPGNITKEALAKFVAPKQKLPHTTARATVTKPPPVPPEEQKPTSPPEPPAIQLEEIDRVRAAVEQLQVTVVQGFQDWLDSLVGRWGQTPQENKRIASEVYDAARCAGIQLICKGQPAYFYWANGVFQAVTTDSSRKALDSGKRFPQMIAQARHSKRGSGIGTPEAPDRWVEAVQDTRKGKMKKRGE
jgi:hypothetical protein